MQWDTGSTNSYRMGKEGKYDLKLAEPLVAAETSDDDSDGYKGIEHRSGAAAVGAVRGVTSL